MKKIAFVLLISLLILPFNGCFGGEEVVEEISYEEYTGVLKSLGGIKVSKNATHILQTEDGDILYVYSDTYDLDDEGYLGNKIEISGEVTEASEKGKDVVNIMEITAVEEVEDEEEEITEETYSNQDLGFSWTVMSNWEVEDDEGYALFTLPLMEAEEAETDEEKMELDTPEIENDYFVVKVFVMEAEMELADWLIEYSPATAEIAVASSVGEDALPSLKVVSELEDVETYYVYRTGDTVYEISHYNFDIDNRTYFRNLFYDALYTFKVIPLDGEGEDSDDEDDKDTEDEDDEEDVDETEDSPSYDEAISYIESSIGDIVSGADGVSLYEFVDPYYVYVNYVDGAEEGRVLLKYGVGPGFDYEVLATFEPGEYTDWELVSGEDEASGMPKSLIEAGSSTAIEIMEGYYYFESLPYEFTIQYPSSWYYSGGGGHYSFSDTSEGEELIGLDVLDFSIDVSSGSSIDLANGKTGKTISSGDVHGVYVERDDSSSYYLEGTSDYYDIIVDMAGSIVD